MKKSRFTETQIVSILKQADAGGPVKDICRQSGISTAMYYQWKSKYGGMEASGLKRVKELEAENAKLKRMYAELALDNAAMKDLIAKKLRYPDFGVGASKKVVRFEHSSQCGYAREGRRSSSTTLTQAVHSSEWHRYWLIVPTVFSALPRRATFIHRHPSCSGTLIMCNALRLTPLAAGCMVLLCPGQAGAVSGSALTVATQSMGELLHATTLGVTQTVTNCNDSGPGSLRAAVASANTDTVDLSQLPTQPIPCSTITLTSGEIVINQPNLTLQGPPSSGGSITISGTASCATAPHCRVLNAKGTGTLTVNYLTIANGSYSEVNQAFGGCINANPGGIVLTDTAVTGCSAQADIAVAGGAYAKNGATVVRSTISNNMAIGGNTASGGGLVASNNVFSKYSTFDSNKAIASSGQGRGGGIEASCAYCLIQASTISNNYASTLGGGAELSLVSNSASALIANSTISTNTGLITDGGVEFTGAAGQASVVNSTVTLNYSSGAAGISFDGFVSPTISSSIVAGNVSSNFPADADLYAKTTPTLANNIIMTSNQPLGGSNSTSDPLLGPLQFNGGPTKTHALLPGSPAIGQGNNASSWSFDQRGPGYPRTTTISGVTATDIGAFQFDTIFADGFGF